MTDQLTPMSASRIKTFEECSWKYYVKYKGKVPDLGNDGSSRGSICHIIFECLGNPRHKKHYDKIIKENCAFASEAVKRLVYKHAHILEVADDTNVGLMKNFILNGLNYDFFGKESGKPTESHSEIKFDITVDEGDKNYRILGFIDKLFLYKTKKEALIRDFKTSKSVYSGKELHNNLQDQFYSLAVSKLYPEFLKRSVEFSFLKFDLNGKGTQKMEGLSDDELEGFEYILTELQAVIDNFSAKDAKSDMAKYKNFPSDNSFSGPLVCGRNKFEGQLKKDGNVMWGCPYKWAFEYYIVYDKDGVEKGRFRLEEAHRMCYNEGDRIEVRKYKGCPAWNRK